VLDRFLIQRSPEAVMEEHCKLGWDRGLVFHAGRKVDGFPAKETSGPISFLCEQEQRVSW